MKPASIKELKQELSYRSQEDLLNICLRLSKFKKENKELLTYLLFDSSNESEYVQRVKEEVDLEFNDINTRNYYFIKKSVRKILRNLKKFIRYSGKKETEIELLIHFCSRLQAFSPPMEKNKPLHNIYQRELALIRRKIPSLHEDLQHDYEIELERFDTEHGR